MMTAFILVPGMFTGTHIWQDTAARLTAAGAEVRTVALTGLDGPRAATDAAVDLDTHIADVLAAVDSVGVTEDRRIVLVGHDYGIHPAVGAADRRAERIQRIVHLDSGLPRDGVPALAAVPDQSLRERLAGTGGAERAQGVCHPRRTTNGRAGAAPRESPTPHWTGSPPSPRPSPWAPCSSRCG
ncbi:hypothetical protein STENM327S_01458 [Streptomyces tendae]